MYNLGIRCLGTDIVYRYINDFSKHYKKPIISIGSGGAQIEYDTQQQFNVNWICVDPEPQSFIGQGCVQIEHNNPSVLIKPAFKTVQDLVKENPEYIDNCIIFLNWCNPNKSEYDYEAIQLLKPIAILTIYERFLGGNGAACGEKFHQWLFEQFEQFEPEPTFRNKFNFTIIAHTCEDSKVPKTTLEIGKHLTHQGYFIENGSMITWLQSNKLNTIPVLDYPKIISCQYSHPECCIC